MKKEITIESIAEKLCCGLNLSYVKKERNKQRLSELVAKTRIPLSLLDDMCWEDSVMMFDLLNDTGRIANSDKFVLYEMNSFVLAKLIKECNDYALGEEGFDNLAEKYMGELDEVRNADVGMMWSKLISTGVFHDAIGKVVEVSEDYVVVVIEY